MIFSILIGLVLGIGMVIYRGLYAGPWNAALNTVGACILASIVCYILLRILAGIGGFFLKIVFIIIIATLILFGGTKIWNTYNPDNPIPLPSSISSRINRIR